MIVETFSDNERSCDDAIKTVPLERSYYDITIDMNDVIKGTKLAISRIFPHWNRNHLKFTLCTTGMTNKLIKVTSGCANVDNVVLVRIYGRGSDLLINRKAELQTLEILSTLGLSAGLYGHFNNGMVYGFVQGQTFTTKDMIDSHKSSLVAEHMATWHKIDISANPSPVFFKNLEKWISLIPDSFTNPEFNKRISLSGYSHELIQIEYRRLKKLLMSLHSPVVFCHQDIQIGNIVYNAELDSVNFIDFEYSAVSYRGFDIANHFCEFGGFECDWSKYPSKQFQLDWLKVYLSVYDGKPPCATELENTYFEVLCFSLASHFMWSVWALVI
jgi:ethanolamine kinase